MQHVDWAVAITQLVGSFSTLVAVLLAWMQNNKSINDLRGEMGNLRDDFRDALRAESSLAFTQNKVPKSAVWKSLHHVTETDITRMTDEELEAYHVAVRRRDHLTPHEGEESAFSEKERLVDAEKARRTNLSALRYDGRQT